MITRPSARKLALVARSFVASAGSSWRSLPLAFVASYVQSLDEAKKSLKAGLHRFTWDFRTARYGPIDRIDAVEHPQQG